MARALADERSGGRAFWAVELRAERRMVGHLYFHRVEPAELQTYELGYIFNPGDQGRGYATEAARALVGPAFATLGTHRVISQCNPANVASWRVLERIGFVRVGHLRRSIFFRRDVEGARSGRTPSDESRRFHRCRPTLSPQWLRHVPIPARGSAEAQP